VIAREIEDFYLLPERPPLAALHRIVQSCRKSRIGPPSYHAVKARVESVDLAHRVARREGQKAADDQFGLVQSGMKIEEPFDLVQIDHTPADVIIVDDVDRRPIGRPWLTLAIDVATRVVAGFCIALEAPSSLPTPLDIQIRDIPWLHTSRPSPAATRPGADLHWQRQQRLRQSVALNSSLHPTLSTFLEERPS
jgi:putative transposase